MASHPLLRIRQLALFALWAALSHMPAVAATPVAGASIAVHPGHFVVAGRAFADVDAAAQALQLSAAQPVRINTCMPGASLALTALVQRLRDAALHILVLQVDEPGCAAAATVPVSMRPAGTTATDAAALDRYWQNLVP